MDNTLHRTHSMNEISARYSQLPEEFYIPDFKVVLGQSLINKQGSEGQLDPAESMAFLNSLAETCETAFAEYQNALDAGIARETSRLFLPVNTYTKKVWQMNLHNLFHFLKLRTDSHAQWEIRQFADQIEKIVADLFPMAYKAWKNHVKEAIKLSSDELQIIKNLIDTLGIEDKLNEAIFGSGLSDSRIKELKAKLGIKL